MFSVDFEIVPAVQRGQCFRGPVQVEERGGADVVLERQISSAGSPAEGLDRDLQIFREPDGIHQVPAVEGKTLIGPVEAVGRVGDHAGVGGGELFVAVFVVEVVRPAEIIPGRRPCRT